MRSFEEMQIESQKLRGKKEEIEGRLAENKVEVRLLKKEKDAMEKCKKLLAYISSINEDKIVGLFEHTLSAALKDIFDDSYRFEFDMKTRRDSSACDFTIGHSELPRMTDIVLCNGKSIQEIVAIIFRIILIKLDKRTRKIVVLDEPGSGIELERQRVTSKFLADICHKFNIQLIVVTHSMEFIEHAGSIVDINKEKKNGE